MPDPALTEGIHDIPEDVYHRDPVIEPSLSASIAKILVDPRQTPRHAWLAHPRLNPDHEQADSYDKAKAFGTVCHKLMLGRGGDVEVIDGFDDFKKAKAKEWRDRALAAGRTPILIADYERAEAVVRAGKAQLARHEDAAQAFQNGQPEQTVIWRETESVWCRARFDWLPDAGNVVYDYKTSNGTASADEWGLRRLFELGSDVQAGIYRRAFQSIRPDAGKPHFHFVVQEMNPPFALNVIALSPAGMALADAKATEAIERWRWCIERDVWPGYPSRTCYVDPPIWQERAFEDQKALRDQVKDEGKELFEIMNDWQAPHGGEAA